MRIGITIGDPAGIGPEVVRTALAETTRVPGVDFVVYGAPAFFEPRDFELVDVLPGVDFSDLEPGRADTRAARLQHTAFLRAIEAAKTGAIDGIVTAPWTKSLLRTIGEEPTGHTELLAEAFDAPDCVMMLAGDRLRVTLVTTHVALHAVPDLVTRDRITSVARTTATELRRSFGLAEPRLAVCGLNPHAGEQGTMGTEDAETIAPAVDDLRREGIDAHGPFPADTLFAKFRDAQPYDAVVCMYHDQGLIPLKTLHFGASANITLGLPIVRTSVDHGTAYDIAGRGVADAGSMRYAIQTAIDMIERRSRP